jgi:hypothetical protein
MITAGSVVTIIETSVIGGYGLFPESDDHLRQSARSLP